MGQSLSINEIQKIKLSSKKTPTARKESNSTKLKKLVNQFDVSISNSTACNFLAFCGHNSEKFDWKLCFQADCKEISSKYTWAINLPDLIKKFKGVKDEYFQSEVPRTLYTENEKFEKEIKCSFLNNISRNPFENLNEIPLECPNKIKSLEESFTEKLIEASLWNSKSNNRYSEGLELVQTLIKSQESSIVRNYYQNNTILNVDENIMRNSQVNEEKSVSFYKAIMKMIEKHLNDKEHPFHMILQTYLTYFIRKVESDKNLKEENVENLLEDVKDFINVIRNSIYIFYNFSELSFKIKKCFDLMTNLFTFDNLTNFFTSFFFYKFEIYDKLFDLLCIVHAEKEELLQKNLKLLQSWSPSDFGVSDSLTLDIKTYKYFQKNYNYDAYDIDQESLERIKNIFQTKNEDLVSTLNYVFPPKNEKSLNLNSDKTERKASQLRLNKKQPKNKQFQPYANAIKKLKLLSSLKGPLHKLKILNETFENIIESISEFYLGLNKNFNNHIESDDLISIILYIISQSQIPNLFTHLEIIENFITPNYLLNIIGYQFVTLKVCLNYFENIKEIENRKDQKLAVSVLRESILLDIKKEAESHNDKNTMFI